MSLAAFDHVFQDSANQDIGEGLIFKAVPPPVLALLKIASYLDDPVRRAKDLIDFRSLMRQYESDGERIFSDIVFEAELPDVEFAGAFLLGLDVRMIATKTDESLVASFLKQMESSEVSPVQRSYDEDWANRDAKLFQLQIAAFDKGFKRLRV
jgi:predicted nucleotidyltransferase